MKAKMLKIAGVKNEKEFYKKFPTEEAFMAKHGKEFQKELKKAQMGQILHTTDDTPKGISPLAVDPLIEMQYDPLGMPSFYQQEALAPAKALQQIGDTLSGSKKSAKKGKSIKKAQFGDEETGPTLSGTAAGGQYNWQTNPLGQQTPNYNWGAGQKKKTNLAGAIPVVGGILKGIGMLKEEKAMLQQAKQQKGLSSLMKQAVASAPNQPIKRTYARPEDGVFSPDQYNYSYGTAQTPSFMTAEDGAFVRRNMIGGIPGEIMNTFAPDTIYSDSGYEPLEDSDKIKQYQGGGGLSNFLSKAQAFGAGNPIISGAAPYAANIGGLMGGYGFTPSGGSTIGSSIGGVLGPVGGLVGGMIGGAFDRKAQKIKNLNRQTMRDITDVTGMEFGRGVQAQNYGFMENGGDVSDEYKWVSHSWQPQVITTFGEHKVSDLLTPPNDADMLRAGGHIRQNYTYPTDYQMAMGGELQTTWGGDASPISYNPFLPGTGETVMFHGNSHDESDGKGRTGIGVKYGGEGNYNPYMEYGKEGVEAKTDVEVERGEPAVELPDAEGGQSLVVYGNLKVPNYALNALGDPDAKGKTFKSYVAQLSKKEQKQNRIIEEFGEKLQNLNPITANDLLTFNTYKAMLDGANSKLKEYAEYKQNAAGIQNAINDSAEEHGLSAEHLAKGITKFESPKNSTAKNGKNIHKAQMGAKELLKVTSPTRITTPKPHYELRDGKYVYVYYNTEPYTETRPGGGTITYGPGQYEFTKPAPEMAGTLQSKMEASGLFGKFEPITTPSGAVTTPAQPVAKEPIPTVSVDVSKKQPKATTVTGKAPATTTPSVPKTSTIDVSDVDERLSEEDLAYLTKLYDAAKKQKKGDAVLEFQKEFHRLLPKTALKFNKETKFLTAKARKLGLTRDNFKNIDINNPKGDIESRFLSGNEDKYFGPITTQYMGLAQKMTQKKTPPGEEKKKVVIQPSGEIPVPTITAEITTKAPGLLDYLPYALSMIPQKPLQEELDIRQLTPEMYALATNQLEPVQAQLYHPLLKTPFDISYQDVLNQNQADFNAIQRQTGYNPAATASLAAQKYAANEKVLAQQFRENMANRMGVVSENIGVLNDAQLKNLQILDQQYVRQAQAKSNTKATTLSALSSIADKIAKNKLENRTLATYSNLFPQYGYRRDMSTYSRFPTFFRPGVVPGATGDVYGQQAGSSTTRIPSLATQPIVQPGTQIVIGPQPLEYQPLETIEQPTMISEEDIKSGIIPGQKKGGVTKKKKDMRNSNVLKAYKNL